MKQYLFMSFITALTLSGLCVGCSDNNDDEEKHYVDLPRQLWEVAGNVSHAEGVTHWEREQCCWYINIARPEGNDSTRYDIHSIEKQYYEMGYNDGAENLRIVFSGTILNWLDTISNHSYFGYQLVAIDQIEQIEDLGEVKG